MARAVFCMARDRAHAEALLAELRAAGFSARDISVLLPDRSAARDFVHEKSTKAPEGAAVGGSAGGVIGGTLGWLAGLGALSIPGAGPFLAAGPLMSALSGAAIGAAVGGLAGTLLGLGVPEYEATLYEGKLRKGRILISVHTEDADDRELAMEIFERAEAEHISSALEKEIDREG
jgi:hypothetical protein